MGQVVKVTLQFQEPFWEELELPAEEGSQSLQELSFIHSFTAPFPTWWTTLPERSPLLVGWVGGPEALALLKNEHEFITDQAIKSLANLLRIQVITVREKLVKAYFHNWQSDPFARGAYSYLPVGGVEAQSILSSSIDDTLFFAGEALGDGHIGTVHGAMMSGSRAAAEILQKV
jgi:monoamine oxidase